MHLGRRRVEDRKALMGIFFVLITGIGWELRECSIKTILACHLILGFFNNSRENKQCRFIENHERNNVGAISKRAANSSDPIA